MDEEYKPIITDEERATRRAQRAEARRKKQREKRRRLLRRLVPCGLLAVLCVGLVTVGAQLIEKPAPEMVKAERPFQVTSVASAPAPEPYARAVSGPDTIQLGEDFPSRCAVLVDLDTRTVLAEKTADTVISPASMTKVLTVLVAAEHITEAELDDTFTMTIDITDYCYVNGCSVVGLMVDEVGVRFTCRNSCNPSEDKSYGGVGLSNVRKRLDLIYHDAYKLEIAQNEAIYNVCLSMPFLTSAEEQGLQNSNLKLSNGKKIT